MIICLFLHSYWSIITKYSFKRSLASGHIAQVINNVEVEFFLMFCQILRKNPKLRRGQIKPFLFQKNEKDSTLQISLQQVIPSEWQNESSLGDKQVR